MRSSRPLFSPHKVCSRVYRQTRQVYVCASVNSYVCLVLYSASTHTLVVPSTHTQTQLHTSKYIYTYTHLYKRPQLTESVAVF